MQVLTWLIPHGHIRKVRESTKLMILRTRYCISELFSAEKSKVLFIGWSNLSCYQAGTNGDFGLS